MNDELLQVTNRTSSSNQFHHLMEMKPDHCHILAKGDSWIAYPKEAFLFGHRSNLLDWLQKKKPVLIFDVGHSGDEAVEMMADTSKHQFIQALRDFDFDVVLFSGGGNDMVGPDDFDFILRPELDRPVPISANPADYLRLDRFTRRKEQILNAYRDLVDFVKEHGTVPGGGTPKVVTHTYDWALPSSKGAEFFGREFIKAWMKPIMEQTKFNITDPAIQKAIIRYVMKSFGDDLVALGTQLNGPLVVVETRGTIREDEWLNEIHPTPEGFAKLTDKVFEQGIRPSATRVQWQQPPVNANG